MGESTKVDLEFRALCNLDQVAEAAVCGKRAVIADTEDGKIMLVDTRWIAQNLVLGNPKMTMKEHGDE